MKAGIKKTAFQGGLKILFYDIYLSLNAFFTLGT